MSIQDSVLFLTSGSSWAQAKKYNFSCFAISYALQNGGYLRKISLPPQTHPALMGICDQHYRPEALRENGNFVTGVLSEIRLNGYHGVFVDFEQFSTFQAELLHQLDQALAAQKIIFYAPISYAAYLSHAILVIPCQVSGGSVQELLQEQINQFGANRIALDLSPTCREFLLPAQDPNGIALSKTQLMALVGQGRRNVFFSRELCCKYFTFMDSERQGHYVLFDDRNTIEAKMQLAQSLQITQGFLAFDDWVSLGE